MLRKYRNALFEMIRAVNMNPRDFKSKEEVLQNFQAFRLQVGDSSLNFVVRTAFSGDERVFDCKYSKYERAHPEPKFPETDYPSVWYKFSYVEKQFQQLTSNEKTKVKPGKNKVNRPNKANVKP